MTQYIPLILEALAKKYNEDRDGIHVSDLLCPRQSVFKATSPKPLTNMELGFFLLGRSMHEAAQELMRNSDEPGRFRVEKEVWFDQDLEAHIDLFDSATRTPLELKTARVADMVQPKPHYLKQLHRYMAMTNSLNGNVIVFMINHFQSKINKDTPLKEWPITFTPEQLLEAKVQLLRDKTMFKIALDAKDPAKAHGVMLDKELNWLCTNCKWLNECQAINKTAELKTKKDRLPNTDQGLNEPNYTLEPDYQELTPPNSEAKYK